MEFASHLMTGAAVMCHRDLQGSLSSMLRPRGQPWFKPRTQNDNINKDTNAKVWLDWAGEQMRRAMYDNQSGFTRATKEGDGDFAAFGQTVISVEPNQNLDGLLYRNWHLRDVAWAENASLTIDTVHRKWKLSARALVKLFPKTVSQNVKTIAEKDPNTEVNLRHIVVPSEEYDFTAPDDRDGGGSSPGIGHNSRPSSRRHPFVSIYVDTDNQTILEESWLTQLGYVIPRWQTISGSQYAYSPSAVIAIPDARMLQQITLTLLESGQKAVDPPMKAVGEAIQGGINTYAGGISWIDPDYDERTGNALEPLLKIMPNLGWGVDREIKIRELISKAFYLDQIKLPDVSGEMTAYEVQKRVEEYIRAAMPLFEPMETEYNGALCDRTFELMLRYNSFGPAWSIPKILQGQDIRFQFESPLQAASSRANVQAFTASAQLLQAAIAIDPSTRFIFDTKTAFRGALEGTGAPADWAVSKEQADADAAQAQQAAAQQAQTQAAMQTVSQGADVAGKIGAAATQLQQGGILPQKQPQAGGAV